VELNHDLYKAYIGRRLTLRRIDTEMRGMVHKKQAICSLVTF
jgi:hypothetical protein